MRAIDGLNAPVMVMAGTHDRHTESDETRELFAAAREPKQLWLIEGARHQNLHRYASDAYEQRVLRFFRQHLERPGR